MLQKPDNEGLLGIEMGSNGVALAHINPSDTGLPVLQSCRFLPREGDETLPLAQYIDEMGLKGVACNVVMPGRSYGLFLSEAPNVQDAELVDAVRWKIKDFIEFPFEEAALDVFRVPEDAIFGNTSMVYVVISRRSLVEEIIEQLRPLRVRLESIDIIEMALRNLSLLCPEDPLGMAMVHLTAGMGNLNVIRDRQLHLCRRFDLDFSGGIIDPLPVNSLALELQRSLEYYEHQMGQEPPSRIYLCGEGISQDKISEELQAGFAGNLEILPLDELFVLPEGCDEIALTNCIGAIGGALRQRETV